MKIWAFFILMVGGLFYLPAQTTLLSENFDGSASLPSGWTQTYETNSIDWTINTGATGGLITSANSGSNNLLFQESDYNNSKTRIITSKIDFGSYTDSPTLTFYHGQEDWSGDQGELRVYYATDTTGGGTWTLLQTYTASVSSWTQRTISLSGVGSSYYIAFEGLTNYDYGVVIDDVVVQGSLVVTDPPSAFSLSSLTGEGCTDNIVLAWNDPGDADSFDVYYCSGNGCDPESGSSVTGVTSPYTFSGLSDLTAYTVKVKANNAIGSTWSSNELSTLTWDDYTWEGAVSTEFSNDANWCGASAPGYGGSAIVPDAAYTSYDPHIGAEIVDLNILTIDEGGYLYYDNDSLDGYTYYIDIDSILTVNGTLEHTGEAYMHVHQPDVIFQGTGDCSTCKWELNNVYALGEAKVTLGSDFEVYKWRLKDDTTAIDLNGYTLSTYEIDLEGANAEVNLGSGTLQFEGGPSNLILNAGSINTQTGTFYYAAGENWTAVNQTVESEINYYNLKLKSQPSTTVTLGDGSNISVSNDFEIVNGYNIDLSNDVSVGGNLKLTSGTFTLGSNDLTILPSGAVTVYSTNDYVVTDGAGVLNQQGLGSGGRTGEAVYPVATSGLVYAPAYVTNAGTLDSYGVRVWDTYYEDGTSGNAVTDKSVDLSWDIEEFTTGGSDVTLKLEWPSSEENGTFDRTRSFITHYNGGWEWASTPANAGTNGGYNNQTATGLSSFSPYAVSSDISILPVELVSLEYNCENNELTWLVASEVDVDYYEVINLDDRSLMTVPAENVNDLHAYHLEDLKNGAYQLKEVTVHGVSEVLANFSVDCQDEIKEEVVLERNGEQLLILNALGYKEIRIFNLQGQLIFVNSLDQIDQIHLNSGVYVVELINENKKYQTKLLW